MEMIVALDVDNLLQAEKLIDLLKERVRYFKVGSRLFTSAGPAVLDLIHGRGGKTFLDLKYHDIPSVIAGAVKNAAGKNIFSLSLHISGGREMLQRCRDVSPRPLLWGITVLTSMEDNNLKEIGVPRTAEEQVALLAGLAKEAGLDGVVCSPREIPVIKKISALQIIVPGIRTADDQSSDQKRTLTPKEAKDLGADFIVVGRPVIASPDPLKAAEKILKEIA